jgi:phosphoglycolate phosphatase
MKAPDAIHPYQTILFDFDFTLGDSSRGILESTNHALSQMKYPTISMNQMRPWIGYSLPITFHGLTSNPLPEQAQKFCQYFRAQGDICMVQQTQLIPGTETTLRFLSEQNVRMGIVTTKYAYRISAILERFSLQSLFELVVGGDCVTRPKPDPEALEMAIQTLEVEPKRVLYVGDSLVDAECAQRAQVPFVGVLSGTTTRSQFTDFDHLAVLDSIADLPSWLAKSLINTIVYNQGERVLFKTPTSHNPTSTSQCGFVLQRPNQDWTAEGSDGTKQQPSIPLMD